MQFICWRCRHEVGKTATECGGCGKALIPAPVLLRPGWRRYRHPDVVVIDHTRRFHLRQLPVMAGLCLAMVALGLWMAAWSEDAAERETADQAEVRSVMVERKTPADDADLIESLMAFRAVTIETVGNLGTAISLFGVGWALFLLEHYFKMRRLLDMLPPTTAG